MRTLSEFVFCLPAANPGRCPGKRKILSQWNSERVREIIERFATGLSPQPFQGWYNSTSNLPRVARVSALPGETRVVFCQPAGVAELFCFNHDSVLRTLSEFLPTINVATQGVALGWNLQTPFGVLSRPAVLPLSLRCSLRSRVEKKLAHLARRIA